MNPLIYLAFKSAWNRRFVLTLVMFAIAMSSFLLLSIERIRTDLRTSFSQSVSGVDLIVGARTGSTQLLLYSVFRLGSATNNMQWQSVQALTQQKMVSWVIPLSLGDSHKGFSVLGTNQTYFEQFRYGQKQSLTLKQGRTFNALDEVVLGSEIARTLGYALGSRIVLSHGDGILAANDHAGQPFNVVGILKPTGTPVDRTAHVSLSALEAIHTGDSSIKFSSTPQAVTAVLVGLKNRAAVFSLQRMISSFEAEPLMAILPGVALDELWDTIAISERALIGISLLVCFVSLLSLSAVITAGLNERRRELAILRSLGAGPINIVLLLLIECVIVAVIGVLLGALLCAVALLAVGPWAQSQWGLSLQWRAPSASEYLVAAAILIGASASSLIPSYRAYRLSLGDGLMQKH